ncbi:MAG: hypothetical protein AABZ44_03055, partial [Elusimicrobiota bacterium]
MGKSRGLAIRTICLALITALLVTLPGGQAYQVFGEVLLSSPKARPLVLDPNSQELGDKYVVEPDDATVVKALEKTPDKVKVLERFQYELSQGGV